MDSLIQTPRFCYDSGDSEGDIQFSGRLEIFAHHARNIHNICIYDNQDVFAKFSLTYNPDEMLSTQVVIGGGRNPEFNEKLELKVNQIDAVLKCEIWMQSRAQHLLEDQLLGFALVPISHIISQGWKVSYQDFSLSSTDLFHSPAGTVQLSLSLSSSHSSSVNNPSFPSFSGKSSSIASEVVLLDPNNYSRVEFPDINAATEDQMIISKYFSCNSNRFLGSFLQLGSALTTDDDHEMIGNTLEKDAVSPSDQNSAGFSSTNTSLSDERNTADSSPIEERSLISAGDQIISPQPQADSGVKQNSSDDTSRLKDQKEYKNGTEGCKQKETDYENAGQAYSGRVGNTNLEVEEAAMQKQIVDMYMKSMQQFTESLAKMDLLMDLKPKADEDDNGNMILVMERSSKQETETKKKDGSRVFYGSRAFF